MSSTQDILSCLDEMKYHFSILEQLLQRVVVTVVITVISSITFSSALEYVNVSRKELGSFCSLHCIVFYYI